MILSKMIYSIKKFRRLSWVGGIFLFFILAYLLIPKEVLAQAGSANAAEGGLGLGKAAAFVADWAIGGPIYLFTKALLELSIYVITGCAYILDIAIRVSLGIGDLNLFGNVSPFTSEGVRVGWQVLRDIANMGFIFALIYIAVRTILGINGSDLQKQVVAVIIGAIFINFSAFASLVVIDAGNGLATVAYNQITRMDGTSDGDTLKDAFGQFLRPQVMLKDTIANTTNIGAAIIYLIATVLYLYAAYILIEAAFMFVIRTIRLMFTIIMSPLAFIAYAIPGMNGYLKEWFETLLRQSMIAPAYIIMLLFLFLFASKSGLASNLNGGESLGDLVGGNLVGGKGVGAFGGIFLYVFMLFMMKTCLGYARKVSDDISEVATSWAGNLVGLAAGGVGGLGRNTLGRAANMYAKSTAFKNIAEKPGRGFVGGLVTKGFVGGVKGTAAGSFDIRNTSAGKAAAKQTEADFGTPGGTGGFEAIKKAKDEKEKEKKEAAKRYETRQNVDAAVKTLSESITGLIDEETKQRREQAEHILQKNIPRLSIKEIETLGAKMFKNEHVVSSLTPSQMEAIDKSEKFSDTDKIEITQARRKPLETALGNIDENPRTGESPEDADKRVKQAETIIRNISDKELENLPYDLITSPTFAQNITQHQADHLGKSYNLTTVQKQKIKDLRTAPIKDAFKPSEFVGPAGPDTYTSMDKAIGNIRKMDAKTIAKLDTSILTHPYFMKKLYRPNFLQKIAMAEGMTPAKLDAIRTAVEDSPDPAMATVKSWMQDDAKGGAHFG